MSGEFRGNGGNSKTIFSYKIYHILQPSLSLICAFATKALCYKMTDLRNLKVMQIKGIFYELFMILKPPKLHICQVFISYHILLNTSKSIKLENMEKMKRIFLLSAANLPSCSTVKRNGSIGNYVGYGYIQTLHANTEKPVNLKPMEDTFIFRIFIKLVWVRQKYTNHV